MTVTIYHNPNCGTSRRIILVALLAVLFWHTVVAAGRL